MNVQSYNEPVYLSAEPDLDKLIDVYQGCSPYSGQFDRLRGAEEIRFALWDNQSPDGKRHDKEDEPAFPWNACSDSRIHLVDSVIEEMVDVLCTSFWRATLRASANVAGGMEESTNVSKLLNYYVSARLKSQLNREVELAAQYTMTYGWCVLQTCWERTISKKRYQLTLQQIAEMSAQLPPDHALAGLAPLVVNPETEDQATELIQLQASAIVQAWAFQFIKDFDTAVLDGYELNKDTARRFVVSLRDNGIGTLPVPFIYKDEPRLVALKPYHDIILPDETTDIQNAPVIFRREFFSEFQLRQKAALENWNQDWVEAAVRRKGEMSTWATTSEIQGISSTDWEFNLLTADQTGHNLIEVLTAFTWLLDDDGIPVRMMTVFHPGISTNPDGKMMYGAHTPLNYDHGQMPFVLFSRHNFSRTVTTARGIPDLLASRQRELKTQRDALIDLTSICVVPPIMNPAGKAAEKLDLWPAAQNFTRPGMEPHFMDIPRNGAPASSEITAQIIREVDYDFGRMSPTVPPIRAQLFQTQMVYRFLSSWGEVFRQLLALLRQFMSTEEYQRLTGARAPWNTDPFDTQREYDVFVTFDPRDLDADLMRQQAEAIKESILPIDLGGRIDKNKLVEAYLRFIAPSIADAVLSDPVTATDKMVEDVTNDILKMSAGLPPRLITDADATAGTQLQIAQQVIAQSPKLQQQLQNDPDFQQKAEMYVQNRQFVMQQNQNAEIGRTGVKPPETPQ